jgi:hypothetical protein
MTDAFKNDVAVSVSIAILLWKDATPTTSFPSVCELVKIELGRVLTHPHVFREYPWLRNTLTPLHSALHSEPWDVTPHVLLEQYVALIKNTPQFSDVGRAFVEMSFIDPAFDMIRRQGQTPRATAESMITTARGVAKTLHIPASQYEAIENAVRSRYHAIFSQLR